MPGMAAIGCEEKGVGINSIELASNTHQMHCVGVASARGARALGSEAAKAPALLLGHRFTPPTRACLALSELVGFACEFQSVDVWKGENEEASFLQINPAATVPVLVDGAFTLNQSHAILRHLARAASAPTPWYPTAEDETIALVDQWLDWQLLRLRPSLGSLLRYEKMLDSSLVPPPAFSVAALVGPSGNEKETARRTLEVMDQQLARTAYLATDAEPTIADLSAACEIEQACLDHEPLVESFAHLSRWLHAMRSVDALVDVSDGLPQLHKSMVDRQSQSKFISSLRAGAIDT